MQGAAFFVQGGEGQKKKKFGLGWAGQGLNPRGRETVKLRAFSGGAGQASLENFRGRGGPQ